MAIVANDLEFRLSNPAASGGNQLGQADANASLGGFVATTVWGGGVAHDLFDRVSGDENAASRVEYRCVFVLNKHATLTLEAAKLWLKNTVSGGADLALGLDPTPPRPVADIVAQSLVVSSDTTPPAGVLFSAPADKAAGLSLGNIPPGFCRAFWLRRSAAASAAQSGDGATVRVEGETTG